MVAAASRPSPPAAQGSPGPRPGLSPQPRVTSGRGDVLLQVPPQSQLPELPNGCEVTSLAMLLSAVGHPVDKTQLAQRQPVDPTPVSYASGSDDPPDFDAVIRWGNPNLGMVGNTYGTPGYGIYHGPLGRLLDEELPGQALDLTGYPFASALLQLDKGVPVLLWATTTYAPTDDWVTWQSPTGTVRATRYEHAVLLVGRRRDSLLINDPLSGQAAVAVDADLLQAAWQQLGGQALTVAR